MTTKRDAIISAADQLFYEQGFEHTSFAHIAAAVNISRGNFYYHFKTKDEILKAVIEQRIDNAMQMFADWEQEGSDPEQRIRCFINILLRNSTKIKRHGCPLGTLSSELAKLNHQAHGDAARLFERFQQWLSRQFRALGCAGQSDWLAKHLLARSQGIATLANVLADDDYIRQEVEQLYIWLAAVKQQAEPV